MFRSVSLLISTLVIASSVNLSATQAQHISKGDRVVIPESTAVTLVGWPAQVFQQPELELFPVEMLTAWSRQSFGFDTVGIESAVMLIETPDAEYSFGWALLLDFKEAASLPAELPETERLGRADERENFRGHACYRLGQQLRLVRLHDCRILIGTHNYLVQMLPWDTFNRPTAKELAQNLDRSSLHAKVDMTKLRGPFQKMVGAHPLPASLRPLTEIPQLVDHIRVRQSFRGTFESQLAITAQPGQAKLLAEAIRRGLEIGRQIALQEASNGLMRSDPVQDAAFQYVKRLITVVQSQLEPAIEGDVINYRASYGTALLPAMTAVVIPAIHEARKAAKQTQAANRVKLLMLALHDYYSLNDEFPTDMFGADGDRLLSWRVRLLPMLGHADLYNEFHLDEPWDSEHNRLLIERMPDTFLHPNVELTPGHTLFLGAGGKNTVLGSTQPVTFPRLIDGSSNTIGIVEANPDRAVTWTRPGDLAINDTDPYDGLGNMREDGFLAGFMDGSVMVVPGNLEANVLECLFQYNDGKVVEWD